MPKRKTPKTPASPKAVATPDPTTPGPVVPSGLKASGPATPSQRPLGPVVAEPFKDIPVRPATHDAMFRVLAKSRAAALLWAYLPEKPPLAGWLSPRCVTERSGGSMFFSAINSFREIIFALPAVPCDLIA